MDTIKQLVQNFKKWRKQYGFSRLVPIEEGIVWDAVNRRLQIDGDICISSKGNLILQSEQHVMIDSGQKPEVDRPAYEYSIWMNSPKDKFGRPLMKMLAKNANGEEELIDVVYDKGKLVLPDGWQLVQHHSPNSSCNLGDTH